MNEQRGKRIVAVRTLILEEGRVLLVGHRDPRTRRIWWMAPGGMVEVGETAKEAAAREVKEETGLDVAIEGLVYWMEWVSESYYCLELYFTAKATGGTLRPGADPELAAGRQSIFDARFLPLDGLEDVPVEPEVFKTLLPGHYRQGFPDGVMCLGVDKPNLPR